ncbi:MAG: histidine phosphatase family protein [Proteobacteria bacterium]|nr:histidine phosphatase family protein [Pseudomonadota bacterium]
MKTLFLLRHAKSSWDDPELKDFERPLSERGTADVPVMANRLLQRHQSVACIISSPAIRAKTTAKLFAKHIKFPFDELISNPELYFAGSSMFLKAASQVDEHCDSAMLVGHNPAITEFVNELANTDIDNIPTCGLIEVSLPVENWSDIQLGEATLVDFDYPKKKT